MTFRRRVWVVFSVVVLLVTGVVWWPAAADWVVHWLLICMGVATVAALGLLVVAELWDRRRAAAIRRHPSQFQLMDVPVEDDPDWPVR